MSSLPSYLSSLNKNQLKAATAMGKVCAVAGAGTGKTSTLTAAIIDKIDNKGIFPHKIFISTFTKKATNEMASRILDKGYPVPYFLGTFHSNARKIIQKFPVLGGGVDVNKLDILDPEHAENFAKEHIILDIDEKTFKNVEKEHLKVIEGNIKKKSLTNNYMAKSFINFVSDMKSQGISSQKELIYSVSDKTSYLAKKAIKNPVGYYLAETFFEKYIETMLNYNAMDFDDLINIPVSVMRGKIELQKKVSEMFDAIFIDEDQDTNVIQDEFANMISHNAKVFFRVGDDGQSIYGWRGSSVDILRQFKNDADISIVLDENYRSTQNILDYSSLILENDIDSEKKNLIASGNEGKNKNPLQISHINFDDSCGPWHEADYIAHSIKRRLRDNIEPKDIAIITRSNWLASIAYHKLLKRNIPVVCETEDLFKLLIVRFVISYAVIASDPSNTIHTIRLNDVFNNKYMPIKGIGEKTLEKISKNINDRGNFMEGLKDYSSKLNLKAQKFINDLSQFSDNINMSLKNTENHDAKKIFSAAFHVSGLKNIINTRMLEIREILDTDKIKKSKRNEIDILEKEYDTLENSVKSLMEFFEIVSGSTVKEAIENIQLANDLKKNNSSNVIKILTIHKAKGLEWNTVFVMGASQKSIFGNNFRKETKEYKEAIRCLYVAFTRPRKELIVTGNPITKEVRELEHNSFVHVETVF